jgi:hypothetical protein
LSLGPYIALAAILWRIDKIRILLMIALKMDTAPSYRLSAIGLRPESLADS